MEPVKQNTVQTINLKQNIGFGEKFSYGLGDVANNLVFAAVTSFITYFYTDVAGLGAAAVGTLLLISRLFDGVTDLGMGFLVDRTKSKYGKARPWLLWMAIPFAIGSVFLFTVPDFGATGKLVYAYITYNLMAAIIYTAINIPYNVMNSLITQDQYQRSVISMFKAFMGICTMMVIGVITLPIVNAFGGGPKGWQMTFGILGAMAAVLYLICFAFTKERVKSNSKDSNQKLPLRVGLKALLKNKYWVITLLMMISVYIVIGLSGAKVYYAQYLLGDENLVGTLLLANYLPMILVLFLLGPLIKRFGKRNIAIIGSFIMLAGMLILAIAPTNLIIVLVSMVVKGIGLAPLFGTGSAFIADTIEYGDWKSGVRTEGLIFSASSLGGKIGSAIGAGLVGWSLSFGGYMAGAAVQSAEALSAIKILVIYLPILLAVLQIILLWLNNLDKEYPKILEELHNRAEK